MEIRSGKTRIVKNPRQSASKDERGQSLLEILIAVTFVSFLFTSIAALVVVSQRAARAGRESAFAQTLLQDMISVVRGISFEDWRALWGSESLAAYWAMDEGADDRAFESVGGNTAVISAGSGGANATVAAMRQAEAGCKVGRCLDFDGTDDIATSADSPGLNFGAVSFSISLWARVDNAASVRGLIEKMGGAAGPGYAVVVDAANGQARGVAGDGVAAVSAQGGPNLADGNFHHVAVVADRGIGRLILYVDGAERASSTMSIGAVTNTAELRFGAALTYVTGRLDGRLDEVRFYAAALNPTEVSALFSAPGKLYPQNVGGVWSVRDGEEAITSGPTTFIRSLSYGAVSRNASGDIVESGGSDDPGTKRVTYRVEIRGPGVTAAGHTVSAGEYVVRSGSTRVTLQTDWSSGCCDEGPTAFPTAWFAAGTNVDYSSSGRVMMAATTSQAQLTSSIFDTANFGGVQPQSLLWQGSGVVKFKLASSPNASGTWVFVGPTGGTSDLSDFYQPLPNTPTAITRLYHSNHRYFRYKLYMDPQNPSAVVEDVAINWSP